MDRDTEDWSNDAENTALHHRNQLHLAMVSSVPVWLSGRALRQQRKRIVGSIPREHRY